MKVLSTHKPVIVELAKGRKMQEVKCSRCGGLAMHRGVDWRPKAHLQEVVCRKCCDHQVKVG